MIELEEKAQALFGKEKELTELYNTLEIEKLQNEVVLLEEKTAAEGFWDDPKEAEAFLKKLSGVKYWVNSFYS